MEIEGRKHSPTRNNIFKMLGDIPEHRIGSRIVNKLNRITILRRATLKLLRSILKHLVFLFMFLTSCAPIVSNQLPAKRIYETTGCSRVRVERVFESIKNNRRWVVVRLNACGQKMIFENNGRGWKDVTWRY